jgi:hypothetical protein
LGISILSRALPAAYAQALQNAKKGGGASATTQHVLRKTIAKEEALQILNIPEKDLTAEAIQRVRREFRFPFFLKSKMRRIHNIFFKMFHH